MADGEVVTLFSMHRCLHIVKRSGLTRYRTNELVELPLQMQMLLESHDWRGRHERSLVHQFHVLQFPS